MVKGAPCFIGYEASGEDDSVNEEAFFTIDGQQGWFDTGDLGYLDANSYLFISGRSKEIINRGGETISPFEIEEALVQHPDVREACAFSAPHEHFQETVGAVIVTKTNRPRLDLPTLHTFLADHLHRSKWPQVIIFMNALPKNNTNKILRIRLAERFDLSAINDDSPPISRLFEGDCPAIGELLTTPIPVSPIALNMRELTHFVSGQRDVTACRCVQVDLSGRIDSTVLFISPQSDALEEKIYTACHQVLDAYIRPFLVISMDESDVNEKSQTALNIMAIERYNRKSLVLPRNPIEVQVEQVWRQLLGSSSTLSVTSSFFDLGGDSLQAGQLVNAIRKKMHVQISVADLFLAPTIEKLSHKLSSFKTLGSPNISSVLGETSQNRRTNVDEEMGNGDTEKFLSWEYSTQNYSNTSLLVLIVQAIPMLFLYPVRRIIIWFTIAVPWVYLMENGVGRFNALVCAIIFSRLFGGIVNPLIGIAAKWIIVGRYKPGKYPLWSADYLRWWLVEQIILVFGKGYARDDIPIIGYDIIRLYHILMGANIGKNVKIHKDAKLGQSDLLTIGDNVVIDVATVRCMGLEEGHMVLLPITIGNDCSIGLKSAIAPGAVLPNGTHLGPLSSSHETNFSDSENRNYCRPAFNSPPAWMVILIGIPILAFVVIISMIPWFVGLKFMVASAKSEGWYSADIHTVYHAFLWWITPQRLKFYFLIRVIKRCVVPFIRLFVVIVIKWTLIGKFTPMSFAEKQTDWNRFRKYISHIYHSM
jgi:acyl carrier protein